MGYKCFCGWEWKYSHTEERWIGKEPKNIKLVDKTIIICPECGNLFLDIWSVFD